MTQPAALELHDLHLHFGAVRAVDGVDLEVPAGERFALLGPSGSGKTTILRLIAGFAQPDRGTVRLAGADVAGLPPERRNVGVVFQDYALFPHRTVRQNIAFGLRMRGVGRDDRAARVTEMLDLVDLHAEADRRPDQLSGGQRQRVALARALAPEPSLLLLDEPLANLDRRLRESLRGDLLAITEAVGITTVLVTHDQEEALSLADRVGVLRTGRLAQVASPSAMWREPADRFVATFLGDMNLLPATPAGDGTAPSVEVPALGTSLRVLGGLPDAGTVADGANGPDHVTAADDLVACLRPEALDLVADEAGGGVVTGVSYAGGTATYAVDVGGQPLTVRQVHADGRPRHHRGDRVRPSVLVDAVRVLGPEAHPGTPGAVTPIS